MSMDDIFNKAKETLEAGVKSMGSIIEEAAEKGGSLGSDTLKSASELLAAAATMTGDLADSMAKAGQEMKQKVSEQTEPLAEQASAKVDELGEQLSVFSKRLDAALDGFVRGWNGAAGEEGSGKEQKEGQSDCGGSDQ